MPNDIENQLRAAIKGLLYTSETDAPFEIVHWRNGGESMDEKKVLLLSGHKPNDAVETMSIEEFFKDLTTNQSWYGAEEKAAAKKYVQLKSILEQLKNPQVFKLDSIRIDIYIIGQDAKGDWVGVKTKAVET